MKADRSAADQPRSVPADARHRTVARHAVADAVRRRRRDDFQSSVSIRISLFSEVEAHRVTDIAIVGDAFAKPMLGALDAAKAAGTPYDISSLKRIISSGVMWSSEVKQGLLAHHDMMLMDTMGSTEGGMASNVSTRASAAQTAKFQLSEGVRVFTDDGRVVAPGSGEIGKIGLSGQVPIGYYKDPKKSAETFREIDGVRYSFPGDYARVEADGTHHAARPRQHVHQQRRRKGVSGRSRGSRQTPRSDLRLPGRRACRTTASANGSLQLRRCVKARRPIRPMLMEYTREHLASYKAPRHVVLVEQVRRAPNGKADYKWAKATALAELRPAS